jgi:hypothetical protein
VNRVTGNSGVRSGRLSRDSPISGESHPEQIPRSRFLADIRTLALFRMLPWIAHRILAIGGRNFFASLELHSRSFWCLWYGLEQSSDLCLRCLPLVRSSAKGEIRTHCSQRRLSSLSVPRTRERRERARVAPLILAHSTLLSPFVGSSPARRRTRRGNSFSPAPPRSRSTVISPALRRARKRDTFRLLACSANYSRPPFGGRE